MRHATRITRAGRAAFLAAALSVTLVLGGCGGIEFQGKIFDAVGLSGDRQEADVRMAERPPLLLPPDPKALPAPGSGVAVATSREDWPQNPELAREQVIKAEDDKMAKEESGRQPLHPYIGKPTLFNKLLPNKKKAQDVDEVPEPDPSDKQATGEGVAQTAPQPLTPHVSQEITTPVDDAIKPTAPDSYRNPNALY